MAASTSTVLTILAPLLLACACPAAARPASEALALSHSAPPALVQCGKVPADPRPCADGPRLGEICTTSAATLKPTQESLGFLLLSCKVSKLNGKSSSKAATYLKDKPIPAVLGPEGGLFITDHHHLTRAVIESVYSSMDVYVCPQVDFSNTTNTEEFWSRMTEVGLVYLKDNKGNSISTGNIPDTVGGIKLDDPYRSLSEYVRDSYGYIKCEPAPDPTARLPQCASGTNPPFLEFIWGDVVRQNYPIPDIYTDSVHEQIPKLLQLLPSAMSLVKESKFSSLPHYNDGSEQPPVPVSIDSTTGCEE